MSRHIIAAVEFGDGSWAARLADPGPDEVIAAVGCDSCGASISRPCKADGAAAQMEALEDAARLRGWRLGSLAILSQGPRDYCEVCLAELGPGPGRDGGRLDARYLTIPRAAEGGGL